MSGEETSEPAIGEREFGMFFLWIVVGKCFICFPAKTSSAHSLSIIC